VTASFVLGVAKNKQSKAEVHLSHQSQNPVFMNREGQSMKIQTNMTKSVEPPRVRSSTPWCSAAHSAQQVVVNVPILIFALQHAAQNGERRVFTVNGFAVKFRDAVNSLLLSFLIPFIL
jgi:hypothetical protein